MRFEDLKVYGEARQLVNQVYGATKSGRWARDFDLLHQARRAAISVLANIAEGYERRSTGEFAQFLTISRGSCGELRALLGIALDQGYLSVSEHAELSDLCLKTSSMLSNLIKYRLSHSS